MDAAAQQLSVRDRNRVLCDLSPVTDVLVGPLSPAEGAGSGGTTWGTVSGKWRLSSSTFMGVQQSAKSASPRTSAVPVARGHLELSLC